MSAPSRPLTISLITPSFNQADYLAETIRSVIGQRYAALEYIVIDGGSTDGSVDVIQRHTSAISYWVSERDRGQTDALNKGFRRATGDVVGYLNSDDLLEDGALTAIAEAFADPAVQWFGGACTYVDERGRRLERFTPRAPRSPGDFFRSGGQRIWQPSTFWRRDLFDRVGLPDATLHYIMDFEFWVRLSVAGIRLETTEVPLSRFRVHSTSKTSTSGAKFRSEFLRVAGEYRPRLTPSDRADLDRTVRDVRWIDEIERVFQLARTEGRGTASRHLLSALIRFPGMVSRRSTWGAWRRLASSAAVVPKS